MTDKHYTPDAVRELAASIRQTHRQPMDEWWTTAFANPAAAPIQFTEVLREMHLRILALEGLNEELLRLVNLARAAEK